MAGKDYAKMTVEELADEGVRREDQIALSELERRGPKAVPPLIALLADRSCPRRWVVTQLLGKLGGPDAVPALLAALAEGTDISTWALRSLAEIKDPRAVAPVISALRSGDKEIREQAAGALGLFGDHAAVEPLMDTLLNDESWYVRCQAAGSLGSLTDPKAVPALVKALDADVEEWAHLANAVSDALSEIDAPLSLGPLVASLKRLAESDDVIMMSNALAKLFRHDRASVLKGLEDPEPSVRLGCAMALSSAGDADCVAPLLRRLQDPSEEVRDEARATLKSMKKKGVLVVMPSRSSKEQLHVFRRWLMETYFIAPGTEGFSAYRTGFIIHIMVSMVVCLGLLILVTRGLHGSPAAGVASGAAAVLFFWGAGVWLGILSHYNPLILLGVLGLLVFLSKMAEATAPMGFLAAIGAHGVSYGLVRLVNRIYIAGRKG